MDWKTRKNTEKLGTATGVFFSAKHERLRHHRGKRSVKSQQHHSCLRSPQSPPHQRHHKKRERHSTRQAPDHCT